LSGNDFGAGDHGVLRVNDAATDGGANSWASDVVAAQVTQLECGAYTPFLTFGFYSQARLPSILLHPGSGYKLYAYFYKSAGEGVLVFKREGGPENRLVVLM